MLSVFKQKTAYEMRISDWSSDVCSSDLAAHFMHPVKSRTAIVTAYAVYGVRHFIVDHPDELAKIVEETGGAKDLVVMVRLATPGGVARYELSRKFGARKSVV